MLTTVRQRRPQGLSNRNPGQGSAWRLAFDPCVVGLGPADDPLRDVVQNDLTLVRGHQKHRMLFPPRCNHESD